MTVQVRLTTPMSVSLDAQRRDRGGMSRSAYIRWLISEDTKRIRRERGE